MERRHDFLKLVVDRGAPPFALKGVYLITDDGDGLVKRVQSALSGNICAIQYRNKNKKGHGWFRSASEIKRLCEKARIPFIINDDPALALEINADGLHLGQEDCDPADARRLLGPKKIIGISTHNLEEALRAEAAGADYIGFGAIYPTGSKKITHIPGPDTIRAIRDRIRIPVVAIGGINRDNAVPVID